MPKKGLSPENIVFGGAVTAHMDTTLDKETIRALENVLATGLYNIFLHWSPDVLVFWGGMMEPHGPYNLGRIEARLKDINTTYPTLPAVHLAKLGDQSTLYGAFAYLQDKQA